MSAMHTIAAASDPTEQPPHRDPNLPHKLMLMHQLEADSSGSLTGMQLHCHDHSQMIQMPHLGYNDSR